MRFFTILLSLALLLALSPKASAQELTPPRVPEQAQGLMPDSQDGFAQGLLSMVRKVLPGAYDQIREAMKQGLEVFCCVLLVTILQSAGCSVSVSETAGAVCIAGGMLSGSKGLIGLAVDTVTELSEYAKLFLPTMAAASSARGAVTSSAALCLGTTAFSAFLSGALRRVLIPGVYLYLAAAAANCAMGGDTLKAIKEQLKKASAWFLKTLLGVFLTYMSVTGAVTGTADKTAVKAAKAAISAVVPVIGKTLADASEALLLSADMVKNSMGIYGIFAFLAIFLSPFLRIGVHYLILKATAALCALLCSKRLSGLMEDFSAAMGLLLGVTGTMCALNIIGTVCFLKGAG